MSFPAMWNGAQVNYSPIAVSASGGGAGNNIVPAQTGLSIVILAFGLSGGGTVTANFQSATTTTTKTGLFSMVVNSQVVGPYSEVGIFATVAGEALAVNLGGAVAVGGYVVWAAVGAQPNPNNPPSNNFLKRLRHLFGFTPASRQTS